MKDKRLEETITNEKSINEKKIYVGIDLDGDSAIVSFSYGQEEPETVSPMAGSEIFQIPMAICYKHDHSGFVYGEEARRMAKAGLGQCEDHLMERAIRGEMTQMGEHLYDMSELLAMFLKKLVAMAGRLGPTAELAHLVLTVRKLDEQVIALLNNTIERMKLRAGTVHIIDHKQSFFYYGSHQPKEFFSYDMGLFEYRNRELFFWCLQRGQLSKPQLLEIREERYSFDTKEKDELFARIIPQAIRKQIISSIFLVGDGFEGDWMKQSLRVLCQGRRAFLGKNLFSKGACFAAIQFDEKKASEYVYIGEHEMKYNVSLKVYERGKLFFYPLVVAGTPWFEAKGSCEVIIDGSPTIDFWIQQPGSREARIESVELNALPERENRTTRISIDMEPKSDQEVKVTLLDVGMGELIPGTGKKWEYRLQL